MLTLVAIGYPSEATAAAAADTVQRIAFDLAIDPDSAVVVRRDREGKFHVTTTHNAVGASATWGTLWGLLLGTWFLVPVFGIAPAPGPGALEARIESAGIDAEFRDQVRDVVQPGTSALFLVVQNTVIDKVAAALGEHGGTMLTSSLTAHGEAELQDTLRGLAAHGRFS